MILGVQDRFKGTVRLTVSMVIEQLVYEAGRLGDAASLLNRLSSE
jgi:hypothetical protein